MSEPMQPCYTDPYRGWLCPRCNRVNAPWVVTCPCWHGNGPLPYRQDLPRQPWEPLPQQPGTADPTSVPGTISWSAEQAQENWSSNKLIIPPELAAIKEELRELVETDDRIEDELRGDQNP